MNRPRRSAKASRQRLPSAAVLCLLAALAPGLLACESPFVGDWQSDKELPNGEKNELSVFSDGTGEATLFVTSDATADWYEFRFDFDWEQNGEEWRLKLECDKGGCTSADDFKMDCLGIRENDGDDKVDCNGDEKWEDYVFNWERG